MDNLIKTSGEITLQTTDKSKVQTKHEKPKPVLEKNRVLAESQTPKLTEKDINLLKELKK